MDENIPKSYSFSQEEQASAAEARQNLRQLSRRVPTYINFTVKLDRHRVAVHIVITPHSHPQFRRQFLFSPHYRYTLCCRSISTEDTKRRIGQAVQDIAGAYFQLGGWDFLDDECCTRDPRPPDHLPRVSCASVAKEALCRYANAVKEANGTSKGNGGIRRGSRKRKKTVLSVADSSSSEHPQNSEGSLSDENSDRGRTLSTNVSKVVKNLKWGLGTIRSRDAGRKVERSVHQVLPQDNRRHPYMYYAIKLLEGAERLQQDAQVKKVEVWHARFLSGSVSLASHSLPARPAETFDGESFQITAKSAARWESVARLINAIVRGLYRTWKEKALLVYHAFAERNRGLCKMSDLGVELLTDIADGVVEVMRDLVPVIDINQPLLDPALFLSEFMNLDYSVVCEALELPSLSQPLESPAQSGWYLGTTPRFQPLRSLIEADPSHTSDTTARRFEGLQPETPFEGSGSATKRSGNNALEVSVHRHVPPQPADASIDGTLPDESKTAINIGLDVPKILNDSTNTRQ